MRPLVGTIWRGLCSRALLSAGTVLLTGLAVASAVLGPIFQVAVTNSYLVSRLDSAPHAVTGLTWRFSPDTTSAPGQALADAAAGVAGEPGPFAAPQTLLESTRVPAVGGEAKLLAREGACEHLDIDGACPGPGEVLLLAGDADHTLTEVGDVLDLGPLGRLRAVGTYTVPLDGEEDYWFDVTRFASVPAGGSLSAPTPYLPAPFVTDPATFGALPESSWTVLVDRRLVVPPDLDLADLDVARRTARDLDGGSRTVEGGHLEGETRNDLPGLSGEIRAEQATARSSVAPAVISLVLVALALLVRLLRAAADLRMPELALASLRGLSRRQMWALGLSEPVVLLLLAVPIGLAAGLASAAALTRWWLVPGLPLPVGWASVAGGLLVVLATLVLAALGVGATLRVTLSDQLTGIRRPRPSSRRWLVARLGLVAVTVAVLTSKVTGPGAEPDATDLILPVLLAIVAGLGATEAVAAVARRWTLSRRGTRSLAGYVATRAVSRRQEGTLVILPITAAIAICVFGAGVYDSAAHWRRSVAATTAPAAEVWTSPLSLDQTVALTRRVDPDGDYLMAAGIFEAPSMRYAVLDTSRLARVAVWPGQWTPGVDPDEVAELLRLDATVPFVTGTRLGLTIDSALSDEGGDLYAAVRLDVPGPQAREIYLGPFPPGESTVEVAAPCAQGCELEKLTLGGPAAGPRPLTGDVVVRAVLADGQVVPGGIDGAGWGVSPRAFTAPEVFEVSSGPDGLALTFDSGGDPVIAALMSGDLSATLPVLAGEDVEIPDPAGVDETGGDLAVAAAGERARSVPLLGPAGSLVDYEALTSARDLLDQGLGARVLARADTPDAMREDLLDQGVSLETTLAEVQGTLDQGAYALTLRLYAVVAVLVLLMAIAGLVVSTSVQLPARRRDAAALRVVGVPRRAVLLGVVVEFAAVLGATAAAGLAAGALAQYVVLRNLTLGVVETIATPALVAAVDPLRLGLLALVVTALFGGFAIVSGALAVRGARGSTLRESAR